AVDDLFSVLISQLLSGLDVDNSPVASLHHVEEVVIRMLQVNDQGVVVGCLGRGDRAHPQRLKWRATVWLGDGVEHFLYRASGKWPAAVELSTLPNGERSGLSIG